ncbi:hypothetical protein [Streptomyces sp. NPDC052721]|uniref:hypothetical protein n=1 Tax=Streptomyces sp. NPDC052721 TaxID=3154955 RepID=UPI00343567A3
MSRETDTPSSGPNGRGGAAYPSGTPPYGTPMASDDGTGAGRSGTRPEEKKTETTLTTRIRINIPGSRPIPPVVVRTPVGDGEGAGEEAPAAEPRPVADRPSAGTAEPQAEPAAQADEKTSDWFAPRKSGAPKGGPGGGATNDAGMSGGSAASSASTGVSGARSSGPGASGAAGTTGARPGGGRPGGVVGAMSVPGGPRSGGTNGKGLPGATGGPVAPGHGGGTGSFDVTEALTAGPRGGGSRPGPTGSDEPRRDDLPYFSENGGQDDFGTGTAGAGGHDGFGGGAAGANGHDGFGAGAAGAGSHGGFANGHDGYGGAAGGARGNGGPGGASGFDGPGGHGGPGGPQGGPAGPTSGPVTGDGTLVPPAARGVGMGAGEPFDGPAGAGFGGQGTPSARSALSDIADLDAPGAAGGPGGPGGYNGPGGAGRPGGPGHPGGPGAPGVSPAGGPAGRGPGGGLSDDTAILTPQKPAPEPGTPGYRSPSADNVSGHTVTSGIPVVPNAGKPSFGTHPDGPAAPTAPQPEPAAAPKAAGKPKKKGRSKLMLLVVGVFVVAGGAYGAGLLMNHTDVPKGTTVLGVDIGGGTRDDAVKKLDDAFGSRVNKPLKLAVGGRTVTLTPENAGLQFDYQATVSEAATSDYNPVHVVGSLFGQKRVVQPVMPVDEEKLQAALQQAGGGSGSATDGTIKFESGGKAVAVYGKAGKAIDAGRSTTAVEQAYRTLVETGSTSPVDVPTTIKQPTVSNAEVDRVMKDFAKPAMSGIVRVQTDAAHSIRFGPLSLPKILGFKAVDGKLVDTYDLNALKEAYGSTFDGVQIQTATGKRGVLPQDVVGALRQALRGRTEAERVGVIDTDPS